MTREEREKMDLLAVEDIKNGMPLPDVAYKYGKGLSWCYNLCSKYNVRPLKHYQGNKAFKILSEIYKGTSTSEIMEKFGISKQRVQQFYNAAIEAELPNLPVRKAK